MKITYKDKTIEIKENETIQNVLKEEISKSEYPVMGAIYNNQYVGLTEEIKEDGKIELLDIATRPGMKIYKRTLIYIFAKVLKELYPDNKATVNYQLSNATYCDLGDIEITDELIQTINEKMRKIIKAGLPITEKTMTREEAAKFLEENNTLRGKLQYDIETNEEIHMYFCEDYFNYCYGILANKIQLKPLHMV